VAHQNGGDDAQTVHPLGDGVIKHGGAAGQTFLHNAPVVAQQALQHGGVAILQAVAAVAGGVVTVGVGVTEAEDAALLDIFIVHGSGSFLFSGNEKIFLSFYYNGSPKGWQ